MVKHLMVKHLLVAALVGLVFGVACGGTEDEVSPRPFYGTLTNEELLLQADTIVRAELVSTSTAATNSLEGDGQDPHWSALLEFTFSVTEYLKGSGSTSTQIVVVLYDYYQDSRSAALDRAAWMARQHDPRWDDREAILFLHATSTAGRYVMGSMLLDERDNYSLASERRKLWLPAAQAPSGTGARGASDSTNPADPLFLLDVPGTDGARAGRSTASATSTGTAPTISLSAFKQLVSGVQAEIPTNASQDYQNCVELSYREQRRLRHKIATEGTAVVRHDLGPVESGQPAGIVLWSLFTGARTQDNHGRYWFEGRDKDVVRFRAANFRPSPDAPGYVNFDRTIETARPLPAGDYQFFFNFRLWIQTVCDKFSEIERNLFDGRLTVTRSTDIPYIQHEAFFDPVDIGDAVGADATNGVLKPNAFSLDGTNTTISSLKWEDGAVSMTLSPTASLADYAIDFIDVTGTTTLSLTSDNASTTALTWTVPDKPWSDGDLLMLRIYKPISNDATLSALALSGVDLAFDPATTTYAASVPATTTQTTVTPTTNHDSATYVVKLAGVTDLDGTIPLAAGDNVITIDVTAEDNTTTKTYSITVTRAAPQAPVTVTLAPRPQGSATRVNITIEWNDPQTCDGQYLVALYTSADYMVQFLGYTPASETPSRTTESATDWVLSRFPDWFAGVTCYPNASSDPARDLGRVSLRAAHPDSN